MARPNFDLSEYQNSEYTNYLKSSTPHFMTFVIPIFFIFIYKKKSGSIIRQINFYHCQNCQRQSSLRNLELMQKYRFYYYLLMLGTIL